MWCVWTLLVIAPLIVLYKWIKKRSTAYQCFPSPPSVPLFGHLLKFYPGFGQVDTNFFFTEHYKLFLKYKTPFRISYGPVAFGKNVITLNEPEDMKIILNHPDCQERAFTYKFFALPYGLFQSDVETWRIHRKLIAPEFSLGVLAKYAEIFNQKAQKLVVKIGEHADTDRVVHVNEFIELGALDTISTIITGLELDFYSSQGKNLSWALNEFLNVFSDRLVRPWHYPNFLYRLSAAYKKDQEYRAIAQEFLDKHTDYLFSSGNPEFDGNFLTMEKVLKWAEECDHMDLKVIKDHTLEIVIAAVDTTTTTISFVLLMAAIHPEIQRKVQGEIDAILDICGPFLETEMLSKFTYLKTVIKETQRLFPAAHSWTKECNADVRLGKRIIPKGTMLYFNIASTHRKPEIWGLDADRFNPDHFSPESVAKRHPYSFIPFSQGPRNCVGANYARLAIKLNLIYLFRNYWFETDMKFEEIELRYGLTMHCSKGYPLRLKRRKDK